MGMSDGSSDDGGVRPNVSYIPYITHSDYFHSFLILTAYLQALCDLNCKIAMIFRHVFVAENMLKLVLECLIHKMYNNT